MHPSDHLSRVCYIDRLPKEILLHILTGFGLARLGNYLRVSKRWQHTIYSLADIYGKEELNIILHSELSLSAVQVKRKSCSTLLLKEFTLAYLTSYRIFKKHSWYMDLKTISLHVDAGLCEELPTEIEPSFELLKVSLAQNNTIFFNSVLEALSSLTLKERISIQNECLPALIKATKRMPSYCDIALTWEEDISKVSTVSLLHQSILLGSTELAQKLIEKHYTEDNIPQDLKGTISLLFLLSRSDWDINKRFIWNTLLSFVLLKVNACFQKKFPGFGVTWLAKVGAQSLILLDQAYEYTKGYLGEKLDNVCRLIERAEYKLEYNDEGKTVISNNVLLQRFLKDSIFKMLQLEDKPLIATKTYAKELKTIYFEGLALEFFQQLVGQDRRSLDIFQNAPYYVKEVQLFVAILQGDIEKIQGVIKKYAISPSINSFVWMLDALYSMELTHKEVVSIDRGLYSIFRMFSFYLDDIQRMHLIIACAALGLFATLNYISLHKHKSLPRYIFEQLKSNIKISEEEFLEEFARAAIEDDQLWVIHYFRAQLVSIQENIKTALLTKFENFQCFKKNFIAFKENHILEFLPAPALKDSLIQYLQHQAIKVSVKVELLNYIFAKAIIPLPEMLSICARLTGENWLCQLTILDKVFQKGTFYLEDVQYFASFEKIIKEISVEDEESKSNLIRFLYGLFYFEQYPSLLKVIPIQRRQEIFEYLFSHITSFLTKKLTKKMETQDVLEIQIGQYSVSCPYLVGMEYLKVFGNILTAKKIFAQCLATREGHPLYEALLEHCRYLNEILEKKTTLPENYLLDEVKAQLTLAKRLIEENQMTEKPLLNLKP